MMNKEFIEQEVNKKLVALFYKLIALTPIKISNNSFFYKYQNEIFLIEINTFGDKEVGYQYPEFISTSSNWFVSGYFKVSDKWNFRIRLPKTEADTKSFQQRWIQVPTFDEITLLKKKKKLLLVKQQYEFTLLDKYLSTPSNFDEDEDIFNNKTDSAL